MKINEVGRIGALNQYTKQHEARSGQKGSAKRKDEVHISAEAQQLLTDSRTGAGGAARAERIDELKQSVETGTYRVDAWKLADKLLPYIRD